MSECEIEKLNKSLSMAFDASLKAEKEEKLDVGAEQSGKKTEQAAKRKQRRLI